MYSIILVFLTVYLFSYNKYMVAEINGYASITNLTSTKYSNNSLIIVKKSEKEDVKVGDNVFYYYAYNANNNVVLNNVKEVIKTNDKEYTYLLDDNKYLSSSYLIGVDKNTRVIHGIGKIIHILAKPAMYFILIVIPIHILFIYETFVILRNNRNKNLGEVNNEA